MSRAAAAESSLRAELEQDRARERKLNCGWISGLAVAIIAGVALLLMGILGRCGLISALNGPGASWGMMGSGGGVLLLAALMGCAYACFQARRRSIAPELEAANEKFIQESIARAADPHTIIAPAPSEATIKARKEASRIDMWRFRMKGPFKEPTEREVKSSSEQPLHNIFENIFLGNYRASLAVNPNHFEKIDITRPDYTWLERISELNEHFAQIDKSAKESKKFLIHCMDGISNSAALLYAYLMSRYGLTIDEAFHFVRSKRPHVQLTDDMRAALEAFAKTLPAG